MSSQSDTGNEVSPLRTYGSRLRQTLAVVLVFTSTAVIAPKPVRAQSSLNSMERLSASFREITRRVSPAVVQIVAVGFSSSEQDQSHVSSDRFTRERSGGSGILVDPSGYIITNVHVIDLATGVRVLVGSETNGTRAGYFDSPAPRRFNARVVGIDRDTDMALLKIEADSLPIVKFADSDRISQGDVVLAIGSPLLLRNSLSVGVVSAVARGLTDDDPMLYIQTDASLNPGASGGALINAEGELIGLNTSILSNTGSAQGMGFAIPSNLVQSVYKQLRSDHVVSHGWIGIDVENITPILSKGLSLPVEYGVLAADVAPDGPASVAGLEPRDIILSIDGKKVNTARQVRQMIDARVRGEKLSLGIQRRTEKLTISVEVQSHTSPLSPLALAVNPEDNLIARLGILCVPLNAELLETMPQLRVHYGLVVIGGASQTQSEFLDLKSGDVIHELNGTPISSVEALRETLNTMHHGDAVAVQIERDGHLRYISFELE